MVMEHPGNGLPSAPLAPLLSLSLFYGFPFSPQDDRHFDHAASGKKKALPVLLRRLNKTHPIPEPFLLPQQSEVIFN